MQNVHKHENVNNLIAHVEDGTVKRFVLRNMKYSNSIVKLSHVFIKSNQQCLHVCF